MDNNPPIPPRPTTTTPIVSIDDDGLPSINPTTIFKRKRTKRQRPTTNATHSSPPSYSNFITTTEDEDTAYCLILLSKHHYNTINSHIDDFSNPDFKFNSKKFIQKSSNDPDGRTGVYVYECKTCSRTFSSFQALGGHRASHTKPRSIEPDQPKPSPITLSNEHDPSRSPQLHLKVSLPINTNKLSSTKLHECSICGAEFNSGQALGGHMRRHRAANANTTTTTNNTNLSLIPYSHVVVDEHDDQKSTDDGICLDLELNLPAPLESNGAVSKQDKHRESSYKCFVNQNKQQPSVHLSVAPTILVDCYY